MKLSVKPSKKTFYLTISSVLAIFIGAGVAYAQSYPGLEQELNDLLKDAKIKVDKANNRVLADAGNNGSSGNGSNGDTIDYSKLKASVYSDGKSTYATSATKFELISSDQLSQLNYVEYKINEEPYQKYTGAFQIEKEGPHRVLYRGVDKAGNLEPESVFLVIIDNSAPKVNLISNATYHVKDGVQYAPGKTVVEIKATDSYSGVKSVQYAVGDAAMQEYKEAISLDKDGRHTFKYKAADNLGNESETKEFTIVIDSQAPTVQIKPTIELVEVDGKKYSQRRNTFAVTAQDDSSGVAKILVRLNGEKDFRVYSTPLFFSEEGPQAIEAKAVDYVGNESEIVKLEFTTDMNPPKTVIRPVE